MSSTTDFFPKIGEIAAHTDATTEGTTGQDDTDIDKLVQEIESLCMKCGEQGVTRMMLTTIPYFREVIVMSFKCEHCGTSNNEVQSAGEIRAQGTLYTVHVHNKEDLSRQLVRSPSCTVYIPTLELTLPAPLETYLQDPHSVPRPSGLLTTIEGLLRSIYADLSEGQTLRRALDEAAYKKIDGILASFRAAIPDIDEDEDAQKNSSQPDDSADAEHTFPPFTLQLDDPAGNSFIEFLNSASASSTSDPNSTALPGTIDDSRWSMRTYQRSKQQDVMLGLAEPDEADSQALGAVKEEAEDDAENPEEVYVFPGTCSSCKQPLDTKMKKVNIPYFQDILIMSTNCQNCGYRDNEIKSGSAISAKGKKITVTIEDREDLSRDLLKSDTAALTIPEIDLHLGYGTLGGRFTTIEGILTQVYEELGEKVFFAGDSAASHINKASATAASGEEASDLEKYTQFLGSLKGLFEEREGGSQPAFTLILDDPLANSYIQNPYAPDEDPNMKVEAYDRTWDQNEDLGLNDINVDSAEPEAVREDQN